MARPVTKVVIGLALLASVLVIVLLVFALSGSPPVPAPLPNPNGYDELVQAGQMLKGADLDVNSAALAELRAFVETHRQALKLARTGLTHESRVPLPKSEAGFGDHIGQLPHLKGLAKLFVAEARLAELENRPGEAVEPSFEAMRLGRAAARGGAIIHGLVGVAIEAAGLTRLERVAPHLNADDCRKAAARLESLEQERSAPEAVLEQERDWTRRMYGLRGQIARAYTYKAIQRTEQNYTGKATAQATRARMLLIQLASRAFELEKGEPPKALSELVPVYLKAIPRDPASGTNVSSGR